MSTEPGKSGKNGVCLEFEHDLENLGKGLRFNKNLKKKLVIIFGKVILFFKRVTK